MPSEGPTVFSGRYELHRRIGRGGMAEVSLARDQLLDRPVAIKAMFPEFATDPSFVERFRREATAAANLNHPNIVGVYDWGEAEGTYFIVMEYVDGRSLSQILRADGPLHPDRVADIGADVAAALGFAHRNGVVHRDVKPGNVLVDQGGQVKVADFGIARAISATTDENLTQAGTVMGTATYFSPEQARGDAVDPRSDLYSLGCVLYELVVGRPPFSGDSPVAIAYKQVHESPVPPRQINPSIPPALEAIILKCLAKNPANRYPSAEDLRADLRRFREGNRILAEPVMAPPTRDPAATGVIAATTAIAPTGAVRRGGPPPAYVDEDLYDDEPRRSSGPFLAVLVALLLLLAGMLFLLARTLDIGGGGDDANLVDVPDVVGESEDSARRTLEGLEFEVEVTREENVDFEPGTVFAQDPAGRERAEEGSIVRLRVSSGAALATVPDVVGDLFADAEAELRAAGFEVRRVDTPDDEVPADTVLEQNPAANQQAEEGSEITLNVSSGPDGVEIPDVSGDTVGAATAELEGLGFSTDTTSEASGDVQQGRVIRTEPGAGSQRPPGSTVTLVVSSGPEERDVPGVIGLSESAATAALENAGFDVVVEDDETADPTQIGRVTDQDPAGGQSASPGDTVTIFVGREPVATDDGGE
jgi:beta-lactam-binding protein with PASTA domain/tRNA A-37 threonylcarbamoyl transferase component Bud32